ncbi:MAG: polysaccharide biosynthesis/export family protein [Candidatus Zipacnadales bacterium]
MGLGRTLFFSTIVFSVPIVSFGQVAYRVSPGDTLDIEVFRHPERSFQVVVRHDGRITHPSTGEINVAGLTIAELTELFTEALSRELRDPIVVINVAEREPHLVYVLGQLPNPGPQQVEVEGVTIKEAIARAGGLQPLVVDMAHAELHRKGEAPVTLNLGPEMEAGPDQGTRLYEGDILIIRPLVKGFVGIVGTAGAAKRVEFEEGDDLLDILAKAGGAGPEVDLQNALILSPEGQIERVDLEAIQEGRWVGDLPEIGPGSFLILPARVSESVTILGRVAGPKVLPIDPKKGLTLAEVLASMTPFPEDADAHNARILHPDGTVTLVDLRDLVDGKGDETLLERQMQPNEIVMVPREFDEVAALGEVARPGIQILEPGDRVLDLLQKAGGTQTRRGQPRWAFLVRRGPEGGEPVVQEVDLAGIMAGRAEDQNIELQPNDVLYVPGPKKKWPEKLREWLSPFDALRSFWYYFDYRRAY